MSSSETADAARRGMEQFGLLLLAHSKMVAQPTIGWIGKLSRLPAGGVKIGDKMSNRITANHGVRAILLGSACMFAMAVPVAAQPASNDQVESVTVTGLISSLQKNLD